MPVLYFDTETTSLPLCSASGYRMSGWPDVIQLAYAVDDEPIVCEFLRPNQRVSEGSTEVHGITEEYLKEHGKDPKEVYARFQEACERCDTLVAHNLTFDYKVILAHLFRLGLDNSFLCEKNRVCTMRLACNRVRAKPRLVHGKMLYKYPRLEECAKAFHIKVEGNYHDAKTDVDVLRKLHLFMMK